MNLRYFKKIIIVFICILSVATTSHAYNDIGEREINVSMRMIGHEVLHCANDNVSRILPIKKEKDRYKIEFSADFEFFPDDLIPIIDKNIAKAGISSSYIVEVENCNTKEVIYSYKVGGLRSQDQIPCRGRFQPKDCYQLFISILDSKNIKDDISSIAQLSDTQKLPLGENSETALSSLTIILILGSLFLLTIGLYFVLLKKKRKLNINTDIIQIGGYQFDKNNMSLSYKNSKTELTSKETDLLSLLHTSANHTLERELILKNVWGDEGDYVGRTLDVFISKLRKKLEADTNIKIINIRGVGYKLVVN